MERGTTASILFFLFMLTPVLSAEESVESLLQGYLSHDLQMQRLSAAADKAELSRQSASISNGFTMNLATGSVVYTSSGSGHEVEFNPTATATLPQAANLTMEVTSDVTSYETATSASDTEIALSADILSGTALTRKAALLKAQRTLLEARRSVYNRALTAEKEFFTELKTLFTLSVTIATAQKDLYEDEITFEGIKAKGYDVLSSKYRSAEMEVRSDQHTVDSNQHELDKEFAVFASKCGIAYDHSEHAQSCLPSIIPPVTPLDVLSFSKEAYTEIETARWTTYINGITRKAGTDFSLKGTGGYTFANSDTDSDTANAGAAVTWSGLSLSGTTEIPVGTAGTDASPAYVFSFSLNPSTFALSHITRKQNKLSEKQESIDIRSAEDDYDTAVITQQSSLSTIQWDRSSNSETLDMYGKLETDDAKWYAAGLITESEYMTAKTNREIYRLNVIINDIELIIYNDETKLLFCHDGELLK